MLLANGAIDELFLIVNWRIILTSHARSLLLNLFGWQTNSRAAQACCSTLFAFFFDLPVELDIFRRHDRNGSHLCVLLTKIQHVRSNRRYQSTECFFCEYPMFSFSVGEAVSPSADGLLRLTAFTGVKYSTMDIG